MEQKAWSHNLLSCELHHGRIQLANFILLICWIISNLLTFPPIYWPKSFFRHQSCFSGGLAALQHPRVVIRIVLVSEKNLNQFTSYFLVRWSYSNDTFKHTKKLISINHFSYLVKRSEPVGLTIHLCFMEWCVCVIVFSSGQQVQTGHVSKSKTEHI